MKKSMPFSLMDYNITQMSHSISTQDSNILTTFATTLQIIEISIAATSFLMQFLILQLKLCSSSSPMTKSHKNLGLENVQAMQHPQNTKLDVLGAGLAKHLLINFHYQSRFPFHPL